MELSRRIVRMALKGVRGRDLLAAEDIALKVEIKILELVLTDKPSRTADFLEISFADAVEHCIQNEIQAHQRSPMGNRGYVFPDAVELGHREGAS